MPTDVMAAPLEDIGVGWESRRLLSLPQIQTITMFSPTDSLLRCRSVYESFIKSKLQFSCDFRSQILQELC